MKRINKKRKEVEFQIGDRVLLQMKHLKITKVGKLKPKFSGPFVVVKRLGPLTYRLAKPKGPYKSSVVHVKRLKRYNKRKNDSEPHYETDSSTNADNEADDPFEVDTEEYWQDQEVAEDPEPANGRPQRVRRKPNKLRDFVCYLYNRLK